MDDDSACELAKGMARIFKALGDANRMHLIYLLASGGSEKTCVNDLAAELGISQPAVSRHLSILKHAGIVKSEKDGNHIYYTFDRNAMVRHKENFDFLFQRVMEKCDQLEKR
ncbi:MAG TPA: metalloregulator ArsR/SmtB family transcription factor [Methanocella sp.]|nr:metalloregulator ArsR/SmtB family transcription factor [Methanocella sp.]